MATSFELFFDLPYDVHHEIFKFLDIHSVYLMFEAYSAHPNFESFWKHSTHFKYRVVEVTVEHLCKGDTSKVDFPMLKFLPPCKIYVKVPAELLELAKSYLKQVEVERLDLKVFYKGVGHLPINLSGITKVTELELVKVVVNTDEIPVTVEKLSFEECELTSQHQSTAPSLVHLTNLTHFVTMDCEFDFNGKLPPLITAIENCYLDDDYIDVSSLPNLKLIKGSFNGAIPWAQLENVDVDEIPEGTFCPNLKHLELLCQQSLKNIHCPSLLSVELCSDGYFVSDVFTYGQQNQLLSCICFGQINDLTLMLNVKILHIEYDERLTEHTPLPHNLVELVVASTHPVDGIPPQLEVFEYRRGGGDCDVTVRSPTLKCLLIGKARNITVNCANLGTLGLCHYLSLVECNVPNVTELLSRYTEGLLEQVPKLRRLTLSEGELWGADLVIDQRLEYISLHDVTLKEVKLSADTIDVFDCTLTNTPTITALSLRIDLSYIDDVTNVTCQELNYYYITPIPTMAEELHLCTYRSFPNGTLIKCENLKSLTIKSANLKPESSNTLELPSTLKKLRLIDCQNVDMLNFANVTEIDYIICDDRSLRRVSGTNGVLKPANFPEGLVSFGPYLWCRPDLFP